MIIIIIIIIRCHGVMWWLGAELNVRWIVLLLFSLGARLAGYNNNLVSVGAVGVGLREERGEGWLVGWVGRGKAEG